MQHKLIVGLFAALLTCAVSAAPPPGTLVIANRSGGSVSLLDLETQVEIARLPIGPHIPHEIAVSPDGTTALTGEYGGNNNPGQHVVVIDIVNARIAGRIDLGPNSRPHSFAFLPDGRRAVATMELSDQLALIDVIDMQVLRTFPTGGREGHMVRLSPSGEFAYVTSRGAEGTLSVINLREDVPPTVIPTGAGAEGLAVTRDGTEVWVVNRSAGSISIVNAALRRVVETIPAREGAGRAEISAAGRVLVPNGTAGARAEKFLTVYDVPSRRVVDELRVGDGTGAFGIHLLAERAFVVDRSERTLALYNLADFPNAEPLADGLTDPDGVGYSPLRVGVF
jgi:DNA-binding beta-propeller fold protein YncE